MADLKSKRTWTFIHAESLKVIYASPEVVDEVKESIKRRGLVINSEMQKDEAFVDNPGMCLINRQYWSGIVDGLKIEIPVSDFYDFFMQITLHLNDPVYKDSDPERSYRTIYGWLHVIALTDEQYRDLQSLMIKDADDVRIIADKESERLEGSLRRANEQLGKDNVSVTIKTRRLDPELPGPIDGSWN
jgi:hypothetical protein